MNTQLQLFIDGDATGHPPCVSLSVNEQSGIFQPVQLGPRDCWTCLGESNEFGSGMSGMSKFVIFMWMFRRVSINIYPWIWNLPANQGTICGKKPGHSGCFSTAQPSGDGLSMGADVAPVSTSIEPSDGSEIVRNTIWLVVWNMFYVSIYWEFHHPNWRTPSFFRGVGLNHQPDILD